MFCLTLVCVCFSDLGTSDDSSLSDSVVQDEGKTTLFLSLSVQEKFCLQAGED